MDPITPRLLPDGSTFPPVTPDPPPPPGYVSPLEALEDQPSEPDGSGAATGTDGPPDVASGEPVPAEPS